MKAGYKAAYGIADNSQEFFDLLEQWTKNCLVKLYSTIFKPFTIERLSPPQKRFLLIDA
jgi:hypothetical protein